MDLIDRQAAISYAISGRIRTLPTSEDGENWIRTSEVRQSLLTMPSAQPERKKGKWRLADKQNPEDKANGNYLYFCSNCFHADLHAKTQEVPYCWYCGAEMEGE